jgi:ABC-type transport system involved in multi-copper enzyme maturation permease subunit
VSLTIAPLFGLLLGLRSFTDEFRYGSIVPTLLANPDRRRVLGAKLVATAGGGIALTLAATAVSIAIGVPLLAKGVEIVWSASAMAEVVGRLVGATVLWTAIGVGLGLAVKHQVAAIAGALVWLLAAEGIFSGLVPNIAKYFPGAAGFAIVGINPADLLTPGLGALLLGSYAAVAIGVGAVLMQRRDTTQTEASAATIRLLPGNELPEAIPERLQVANPRSI